MLNYVSNFIPAKVAKKLTPVHWALIFEVAIEAVQWAQVTLQNQPPEIRKKEALEFASKSWKLFLALTHDPDIKEYIESVALPSCIDGVIKTFNLSGWFATAKPVQYGGPNNPAPVKAVSQVPGASPPIAPNIIQLEKNT